MKVPSLKFSNGNTIPQVGFGLWKNKNKQECIDSVNHALEAGYRHFDTAQIYGNEQFLGEALAKSKVSRAELFITTKIWNGNLFKDDVIPSFDKSLQRLGMDYVDLLLIHFPVTGLRVQAWEKLEEIHKSGRAKSIGVSNFTIGHLEELLKDCKIKPAVNQVELHVFLQQPELLKYCEDNGIVVEAYSPLAHGKGLDDPVLGEIAQKHGKTSAQIMVRWCIEQGLVPLPKSTNQDRIKQNIEVFDFKLDKDDLDKIISLERDLRTCWDPSHVT